MIHKLFETGLPPDAGLPELIGEQMREFVRTRILP